MMARLPGFRALHGRPCQVATWLLVVGVGAGGELPVERCDVDGSLTSGLLLLHFRTGGRFSSRSSRVGSTRSSEEGSPRSAREATSSDGGGAVAGGAAAFCSLIFCGGAAEAGLLGFCFMGLGST